MAKEMAKIIFHLIMILLNHDAMKIQNVIFIVKVKNTLYNIYNDIFLNFSYTGSLMTSG